MPSPLSPVGEGLLPEHSIGVIQGSPRNTDDYKLTHTRQLWTMTDKGRLLTDSTASYTESWTVIEFASGKSMHNPHS